MLSDTALGIVSILPAMPVITVPLETDSNKTCNLCTVWLIISEDDTILINANNLDETETIENDWDMEIEVERILDVIRFVINDSDKDLDNIENLEENKSIVK
jgi:hypothetical protein